MVDIRSDPAMIPLTVCRAPPSSGPTSQDCTSAAIASALHPPAAVQQPAAMQSVVSIAHLAIVGCPLGNGKEGAGRAKARGQQGCALVIRSKLESDLR